MAKKAEGGNNGKWAGTAEEWQRRAGPHNVTLTSGQRVTLRLLGLAELTYLDAIPERLKETVALHLLNRQIGGIDAVVAREMQNSANGGEAAERFTKRLADVAALTRMIAVHALVEPKITDEMIVDGLIPWDDVEEVYRLATGQQPFDARGVRIGVEDISVLERFRHHHECAPGCPACEATVADVSSLHVGAL